MNKHQDFQNDVDRSYFKATGSRDNPPVPFRKSIGRELLISLRQSSYAATRVLIIAIGLACVLFAAALTLFRNVNPPISAVMIADQIGGAKVDYRWVPLEQISANLARAVIVSEDVRFCHHNGVDMRELKSALEQAKREGMETVRGASTIPMQVAKNLFLWQDRTLLRKGLEIVAATAIDMVWTKRRTLEIYLNIAQWGHGIYGAEAAAQHHFGKSARQLSPEEAALLAVSLPNPVNRSAGRPSQLMRRLARRIQVRKNQVPGAHMCIFLSQHNIGT